MENPFELILSKLEAIERKVSEIQNRLDGENGSHVLDLRQAAQYLHISKSALYRLTSQRTIPHFKRGKRLYFKKEDLAEWMTQNRVTTQEELEKQALNYIIRNPRPRF